MKNKNTKNQTTSKKITQNTLSGQPQQASSGRKMNPATVLFVLFTIIFISVYFYAFDKKLDLNGDNVQYLSLAKNISKGLGYTVVKPFESVPASHYPPGYSAFLAFFMVLGINNLIFFKVLNGLFWFLSLAGLYYLVRKATNNIALAFSGILLSLFSPNILHFSSIVMSEMLFLASSVLFFVSVYKYSDTNPGKKFYKSPWFYLSIVAVGISYYLRTVGAALIFALLIFHIFRKEWLQTIASFAGVVLLLLPWSVRNSLMGIESRYFGTIMTVNPWRPELGSISTPGEMFDKMLINFDETVIKGFRELLFPFLNIEYETPSTMTAIIAGLLVVAVVFYGAWYLKVIRWPLIAYLLGQIGLFMLWHGGNGSRYVVPVASIIFVCFYTGIYGLIRLVLKTENNGTKYLPYAFVIMLVFMMPPFKLYAKFAKEPFLPAYQNYFDIALEMNKQVPGNTICCCRKPELFMYFADKVYAVNYKYTTDTNELISDLIDKKVDYVVLEQLGFGSTGRYLFPAINANMDLFYLVWQLPEPDTYLLKFDRKKASEKLKQIGYIQ